MAVDRIEAIEALLAETEAAHGAFEATELKGVYDQEWPRWYAAYAVEHGIGTQLGHEVTADSLADSLARIYAAFEEADHGPGEPWTAYAARRIVEDL